MLVVAVRWSVRKAGPFSRGTLSGLSVGSSLGRRDRGTEAGNWRRSEATRRRRTGGPGHSAVLLDGTTAAFRTGRLFAVAHQQLKFRFTGGAAKFKQRHGSSPPTQLSQPGFAARRKRPRHTRNWRFAQIGSVTGRFSVRLRATASTNSMYLSPVAKSVNFTCSVPRIAPMNSSSTRQRP